MSHPIVTIFGSGSAKENSRAWRMAHEAGFCLAKAGFVVANGGYGGTMEASARGAKEAGGRTIGVTVSEFPQTGCNPFIDEEVRMKAWHERLVKLIELGDGFLVLDGGTGTLAELVTVWEMVNKHLTSKPVVVMGASVRSFVRRTSRIPEVKLSPRIFLCRNLKAAVECLKKEIVPPA